MGELTDGLVNREVGPQLLPDALRRPRPDRPAGAEVVGLESEQQIRAHHGEYVSELDRPEAAVSDDQVSGAGGASQQQAGASR